MTKKLESEPTLKPMDEREAAQFLIRLATTDVKTLRMGDPGALPSLCYQLRRYLGVTGEGRVETELRAAERNPLRLVPLVRDTRKLLEALADGDYARTRFKFERCEIRLQEDQGSPVAFFNQRLRDAVLMLAMVDDFSDSEMHRRIRRCQRCRRLFYAGKLSQRYCEHRCANLASTERWSKEHPEKRREHARRAAHKAYWIKKTGEAPETT